MKPAQLNQQEEQERIKKQRAELQKIKNEIRPAFAVKGKRKVVLYNINITSCLNAMVELYPCFNLIVSKIHNHSSLRCHDN